MVDVPIFETDPTVSAFAHWQRFVASGPSAGVSDSAAAPRPVVLESWIRCRAAAVDATVTSLELRLATDAELARRYAESAVLVDIARPHLEWLSTAHASVLHAISLVDRDGVVLYSTGTDREFLGTHRQCGTDWSEARVGTTGGGTSLLIGEPVIVDGAEHFTRALHGCTCMGAPVRGPAGEIVGAIDFVAAAGNASDEQSRGRLLAIAHAAYAVGQELRHRDSLARASGQLETERRLTDERSQRLAALEALGESEARFRGAFDHAAIGMAITRSDGRWLRVNRALCEILGYSEQELIECDFRTLTHPDDLGVNVELFHRAIAGEIDRYRLEKRFMHRQGHAVWVELSASLVRDANGAPLYFVAQFQDVTEQKRAAVALRESEDRNERNAANAPGMVYQFVYRPDGTKGFTLVGEGAYALVGVAPEEILRDSAALFGLVHPDEREEFSASAASSAAARAPWRWEGRVILRSGEEKYVQAASRPQMLSDGTLVCDGLLMDDTERRASAARLEESEERYRSLFDNHPDAVCSLDAAGRFLTANPACETICGYPPEELVGGEFGPLLVTEHREPASGHFRAALGGTAQHHELAIRHRLGHRVEIDVTTIPVVVAGRVVGVFCIAKDLTARRELEGQLRQAQKMEAVGQLAGGIAHDFNNILAAITGYAELLGVDLDEDDVRHADLDEILKGARRATGLTRQLLAFSRKQVLQPEALELNQIVADAAAMLRPLLGASLHLVTLPSPEPAPVLADRTQIEQVLMNLALNARDAMPGGGMLTIEVSVSGQQALLVVSDTGSGMSPEVKARAFEPFFTTKPVGQGTGLGLATVHGIVQQSGGSIRVDSHPGAGTTFTVTLPLAEPPARSVDVARRVTKNVSDESHAGTVLLVEDEEAVRVIARRVLERAGYRVLIARHGADALQLLAEHGPAIDALLSDVVMPEMGGVELAARAVERAPQLRVILMSGYTDADIGAIGQGGLVDGFVQKPFTAESLLDALQRVAPAAQGESASA